METLPIVPNQTPVDIAERALEISKTNLFDIVILDTAGRLHSDDKN